MNLSINNIVSKDKKLKGNISILVIFVLLASSLIGILTMDFIKQMVSYTNDIYSYHKSYYQAKAGLELGLTQINNAGIGFSNHIDSGDAIFKDNFDCSNCGFEVNIVGKTQYLSDKFWLGTGCDDETAFVLNNGESMILPLFSQDHTENNFSVFDNEISYNSDILKYINRLQFINNQDYQGKFNLGLIVLLDGKIQKDLLFMKSFDGSKNMFQKYFDAYENYYGDKILQNNDYLVYFVISNIENRETSFCVYMGDIDIGGIEKIVKLPTTKFFVSTFGSFLDKRVGLQAIYGQPVPVFLVNTYGG